MGLLDDIVDTTSEVAEAADGDSGDDYGSRGVDFRPQTLSEVRALMIAHGARASFAWTAAAHVVALDRAPLTSGQVRERARSIADWHATCWERAAPAPAPAQTRANRAHLRHAVEAWCGLTNGI